MHVQPSSLEQFCPVPWAVHLVMLPAANHATAPCSFWFGDLGGG